MAKLKRRYYFRNRPGTGKLTEKIIEKTFKANNLKDNWKSKFGNKVEVINEDILKYYNKFKFRN